MVCGTQFPAAREFCPVCMLRGALGEPVEPHRTFSTEVATDSPDVEYRYEHYELMKGADGMPVELGRGSMGVTYKALDVDLRCPVTLKVTSEKYIGDEATRSRFVREARVAASLRHPHVASVFHLGKSGENYFYAMEFVEGQTLEGLIKRSGRIALELPEASRSICKEDRARTLLVIRRFEIRFGISKSAELRAEFEASWEA